MEIIGGGGISDIEVTGPPFFTKANSVVMKLDFACLQ